MVEILTIMQLLCNVQLIQRGDLLKVPPAAKVPADGIAVCGASPVNKSMITGESSPAANKMGDSVIDGTLNMNGVMHIQAMRVGRNTALAQIINLVEAAQMTKAPIQKFADCVASIFVPVVVSMAVTTFLADTSLGN
jgi:Cu+-exporting ATPase